MSFPDIIAAVLVIRGLLAFAGDLMSLIYPSD
jgi:hypothetical protein